MRLFAVLALAAAVAAPTATTGTAENITLTSATLTGTVDPNQAGTTYHFEYGTDTSYGLRAPMEDASAGDGDEPVRVQAPVSGLSAQTTYHYRLVATNAEGDAMGADRTFRTADAPRPPGVSGTRSQGVGPQGATLRSLIDLNDGATHYHFEYGRTAAYGARTPERQLGTGDGRREVTEAIGGLEPFKRYHFRLVATNEAGTGRSLDHAFTTARLPTGVTISLDEPRTPYGEGIEVFGRVSGVGANGIPVAIERQDFPYTGPFTSTGMPLPQRATRDGEFRIFVPQLFEATRLRAVTRTAVVAISPTVTANVAVKVGLTARKVSHKRKVRLSGRIRPTTPNGRAVLQRRTKRGGWTFVRSKNAHRRYTFVVKRRTKARTYRVRVIARDGGAHVPGTSRKVKVKRRR
jgi:hypothetical protein